VAMFIRPEQQGDERLIHDLTLAAFAPMPFSDGSEAAIIAGLREDGDLTLSLVAVEGSEIVGHIAFSPVTVGPDSDGWFGSALISAGLSIVKSKGAKGCALVGDPDYYRRFGFHSNGSLRYDGLPARYVQALSFENATASGHVRFSPAFER
jgi:putative acetyltransferase